MTYRDFKGLTKITGSDKIQCDKVFNISKNPKCGGCQRGLASMVFKFFGRKTSGSGIKNRNISNKSALDLATEELAEELYEPIIRIF